MLSKLFITLVHSNPSLQKALWKWWYERLAHRGRIENWTFMNYGFIPKNGAPKRTLNPEDEGERVFIQLYDHASSQISLEGKKVLEVGSGRGGGASFVARYYHPSEMTGLDYSPEAVKLSSELHKDIANLSFVQGDAEALPFEDNSFDAVINVESSHCYGDAPQFIKEVVRILKPGGYFSWVDIRGKDSIEATEASFALPKLKKIHDMVITPGVIEALDEIHDRKSELIDKHVPAWIRPAFKDFAGVKDSKIYNAFKNGATVYMSKAFQKTPD